MGTISRFIGERCLDSGGNYVLAYDTTVTGIVMCRVVVGNLNAHQVLKDPDSGLSFCFASTLKRGFNLVLGEYDHGLFVSNKHRF